MNATVFSPFAFMLSTMPCTRSGVGCGVWTTQGPPSPGGTGAIGDTAIIGIFISMAAVAIASVWGAPDVPMRTSTFSCSTSLRALRADAVGSEPSSSWMTRIFSPPISPI